MIGAVVDRTFRLRDRNDNHYTGATVDRTFRLRDRNDNHYTNIVQWCNQAEKSGI